MDDVSDNIAMLPGATISDRLMKPTPEMLEMAESFLDRVKSGETTGFAIVEIRYDLLGFLTSWHGANNTLLIGAVSRMLHEMNVSAYDGAS